MFDCNRYNTYSLDEKGKITDFGRNKNIFPGSILPVNTISCGYDHCLALISDGTIIEWGTNAPYLKLPSDLRFVAIKAGYLKSYAIAYDGDICKWGLNEPFVKIAKDIPNYILK